MRAFNQVVLPKPIRQMLWVAIGGIVALASCSSPDGDNGLVTSVDESVSSLASAEAEPSIRSDDAIATKVMADNCVTSGSITATGVPLLEPVLRRGAERYLADCPGLRVVIDRSEDDASYLMACRGRVSIVGALRPPDLEELAQCETSGVEITTVPTGHHVFVVVTNQANPLSCLSMVDIATLTLAESEQISNWTELADQIPDDKATTVFPDLPLVAFGPKPGEPEYGALVNIIGAVGERNELADQIDFRPITDSTEAVSRVGSTIGGAAIVPLGLVDKGGSSDVKVMSVAAEIGAPCVEPSAQTVTSGEYPLSSSLFISVGVPPGGNQSVESFVGAALGADLFEVPSDTGGFVPLNPMQAEAAQAVWQTR